MKIHPVIVFSVIALCSFQSANSLPKYAGASDWTQYLPGQKRAISSDIEESSQENIQADISSPQALPFKLSKTSPSPMNPFLSLRPFLPVKPTFLPPFVDPQIFVDKKTAFLNNLFSPPSANIGSASVSSPNPAFWLPAASPSYFAQKKTQFLDTLFSNLATKNAASGVIPTKRDLSEPDIAPTNPKSSLDSSLVPSTDADKKANFIENLFAALNLPDVDETMEEDTVKPTIVPPNFWVPFISSQADSSLSTLPRVALTKVSPAVDPSFFIDKKTKFLNTLFSNLGIPPKPVGIPPTKAPIVPASFWIPPGIPDTGSIYKQKVSDFLDKLFKSLNTTVAPVSVSARDVESLDSHLEDVQGKSPGSEPLSVEPRFIGGPTSMWGPAPAPVVDPKVFIDKKNAFLTKLFTSLNVPATSDPSSMADIYPFAKPTIVPANFWSPFESANVVDDSPVVKPTIVPPNFWSPFASANAVGDSPIVKPTIVPPNFWSPFASAAASPVSNPKIPSLSPMAKGVPAVDPKYFVDKKTTFLNNLFNSLSLPAASTGTSSTKPAPNSVIPGSAVSSEISDVDDYYNEKVSEFLDKLFNSLDTTNNPEKRSNDDTRNADQIVDLISDESPEITDNLSKRTLPVSETTNSVFDSPLLVAKDKVMSSIITELGGIKNEMMGTLAEILKQQKEAADAAASTPASPFGMNPMKSAFAYGAGKMGGPMFGAGKMGGPMYGAAKKGGSAASDGKKKTGPPFGGSFPFWGPTPTPKPTPDPTLPLQKRLEFLNQVFEMLTKLQKDVTSAVNQAASDSIPPAVPTPSVDEANFLNLIQKVIQQGGNSTKSSKSKLTRPKSTREVDGEHNPLYMLPDLWNSGAKEDKTNDDSKTRSIKMAVHQGYQSLPPGTEELIESGGGTEVDNHEGGGLKLQDDDYEEFQDDRSERKHHHHHNHKD